MPWGCSFLINALFLGFSVVFVCIVFLCSVKKWRCRVVSKRVSVVCVYNSLDGYIIQNLSHSCPQEKKRQLFKVLTSRQKTSVSQYTKYNKHRWILTLPVHGTAEVQRLQVGCEAWEMAWRSSLLKLQPHFSEFSFPQHFCDTVHVGTWLTCWELNWRASDL